MPRAPYLPLALAAALLTPIAHAQPPEPPPEPPPSEPTEDLDRAEQLYREGKALVEANNLEGAYEKYKEAFSLKQSFDIAANLGAVELALGKNRDAAEHLDFSLRRSPVSDDPEKRQKVKDKLAEAKQKVGTFRVKVSIEGAAVTCDGRPAIQLDAVFVDPGPHELKATIEGHPPGVVRVEITAGQSLDVTITIPPPEKPDPNGNGLPKNGEPGYGYAIAAGVSGAVALGGIALAVVSVVLHGNASDDIDSLNGSIDANGGDGACASGSAPPQCTELSDAINDQSTFATLFPIGLIIGGVGAAAAATFLVLHFTQPDDTEATLVFQPSLTGARLNLRF